MPCSSIRLIHPCCPGSWFLPHPGLSTGLLAFSFEQIMGAGEKQQGGGGEAAQNGKQEHALHWRPSSDRCLQGPMVTWTCRETPVLRAASTKPLCSWPGLKLSIISHEHRTHQGSPAGWRGRSHRDSLSGGGAPPVALPPSLSPRQPGDGCRNVQHLPVLSVSCRCCWKGSRVHCPNTSREWFTATYRVSLVGLTLVTRAVAMVID